MVVAVSFNKRLPPAAVGRGTLAELMAKQKGAADLKNQYATQAESPTIMQGVGNMANLALQGFKEGRAGRDLDIQQARQRELMQGVDPAVGATQEQIAAMGEFDPKLMMEMWADRAQKLRADAERENWQPLTPEEYAQYNIEPTDKGWVKNITNNDIKKVGGKDSPLVTVGGETDPFFKKFDEGAGADWAAMAKSGGVASAALGDMATLRELLSIAPTGAIPGMFAEKFGAYTSSQAAAQSIIEKMVPTLHVEGSGATSDLEFGSMRRSLPSLRNRPELNMAIISVIEQKAKIQQEIAAVANAVGNRKMSREEGTAKMQEIYSRSLNMPPELRKIIDADSARAGNTSGAPTPTITGKPLSEMNLEELEIERKRQQAIEAVGAAAAAGGFQ